MSSLVEIVIFLARTSFRLVRDYKTSTWPTVEGEIQTSGTSGSTTAEIAYTYFVNGDLYSGIHKRAFSFDDSAKEYAKQFIPKWKITVRYRASAPGKSFVSAGDQVPPPAWATRYRE